MINEYSGSIHELNFTSV